MKIDYVSMDLKTEPLELKWGFHQEILDQKEQNMIMGYKINKNENIPDECYFYYSLFKYDNLSINDNNGIFLGNNVSQKFIFNKNNNFLKFSDAHVEKEKDVNIAFNLTNNETYKLKLFINDLEIKNEYKIVKNETVIIKSKDIKEICQNEQQICKISFNLILENILDESVVEIKVSAEMNKSKDKEDKDGKKKDKINTALLVIIIIAIIIVVALLIIIIIKIKNKKEDILNGEIGSIRGDNKEKILNELDN